MHHTYDLNETINLQMMENEMQKSNKYKICLALWHNFNWPRKGWGVYVSFLGNLFEDSELETFWFNSFHKSRSSGVGRRIGSIELEICRKWRLRWFGGSRRHL